MGRSDAELAEDFLDGDSFLTTAEVAALYRVDVKTVSRWAHAGRISARKTPGGGWRFLESVIRADLEGSGDEQQERHARH